MNATQAKSKGVGIDYGMGTVNIDRDTGPVPYRYGVIPANDILHVWADEAEPYYGPPTCPHCIEDLSTPNNSLPSKFPCPFCGEIVQDWELHGDEPLSYCISDGEYQAEQAIGDCDVFFTRSPYFTRSAFCSPCAPGAGYLRDYQPEGERVYCPPPDWFAYWDESGSEPTGEYCGERTSCPYPVWRRDTGELVFCPGGLSNPGDDCQVAFLSAIYATWPTATIVPGIFATCPDCLGDLGVTDPGDDDEGSFSQAPCDSCGSRIGGDRYTAHAAYIEGDTLQILHINICRDCLFFHTNGDLPDQWEG